MSILGRFDNFWWAYYAERGFKNYLWSLSFQHKEGTLAQSWPETIIVPPRYRSIFFPFPSEYIWFCPILPVKTVAMENAQWRWHCEHRHSSSSDNYVFSPKKDCNFQGDNTNRQGEGGKACKARSLEFQSTKKTLRVINKMAEKKQLHCWRGTSVCSHHDMTRERRRRLYSCCVVNMLRTNWEPLVFMQVNEPKAALHLVLHWICFTTWPVYIQPL